MRLVITLIAWSFVLFSQLEQLHIMGITDDAACLHALEATGGDIQAALEILLGSNSGL